MTRAEILREAERIVTGGRNYGTAEDNFGKIAALWTDYLGYGVEAVDVAAMMALLKIARISTGEEKADNWVDLAGYAACGGEIAALQGAGGNNEQPRDE